MTDKAEKLALELDRLMARLGADDATLHRALQKRKERRPHARKIPEDELAMMDMGLLTVGVPDWLRMFKEQRLFKPDQSIEIEKVAVCRAAAMLADYVRGNSRRAKIERLRRKFRKNEKYYRSYAENCSAILGAALMSSRSEECYKLSLEIKNGDPTISWYVSYVAIPMLAELKEELRARIRELDDEIGELAKRQRDLELQRRWKHISGLSPNRSQRIQRI